MTLIQRSLGLIRRIRFPQFADARFITPPIHSSISPLRFNLSEWRKSHWDLILGLTLAGPSVILIGFNMNNVHAESASDAQSIAANEEGEAFLTGLRRVEDGSVVSNEHTIKWRIFTDNGRDFFLKGKLDEAEKFFKSALQEAKEGFGPRDPHVASAYNNLAELYRVRKAFENAEPLYLEAINILEEAFGTDDIRVGAACHNLGQFYLVQRKLEQARKCYERALKIEGRVLGHGHPDYANTMYHLGMVLHLLGKDKDSEALIQESIRILEEGGLGESTTCMRRMRYLSQILLSSNKLVEVEKLQRKILHILELSKGWDSLDTVIAAEGLALTLLSLGSFSEAHDLLERCLDARKKILPHDHIQMAVNMLHLGRVAMHKSNYLRKVDMSEARSELEKAKFLVDDSIRISKAVLDYADKNQTSLHGTSVPHGSAKDQHMALLVLLQSLDFVSLLDITKGELLEPGEKTSLFDAELALHECISIFKEPRMRSLLNSPDVMSEYLSCLKHLTNLITENVNGSTEKSRALKELRDDALRIEAELSPKRRQKK